MSALSFLRSKVRTGLRPVKKKRVSQKLGRPLLVYWGAGRHIGRVLSTLADGWTDRESGGVVKRFAGTFSALFQAIFFLKLCANANNPVSTVTFPIPRSINRLNWWLCLMLAKTGSVSKQRFFRFWIPRFVFKRFCAFCFNRCQLRLTSIVRYW